MATTTTWLLLRKPATSDNVSVTLDISNNMDLIDALMTPVTPTTQAVGDAAVIGATLQAARVDHKHGIPAFGSPVSVGAANSNGVATTLARADHVHDTAAGFIDSADKFAAGVIDNAAVNASAGIVDTKLATISTANKVNLSALDIDGGTDIGAALVDADLMIVDDGAGGTNRKSVMSRLATYLFGKVSSDVTINSTGTATIAANAVDTAEIAANAVSQLGSDTGGGDTNTGTVGTLANITSTVVVLTLTGGKGFAIFYGSFTDTVSNVGVSLAINISGGTGDVGTGLDLFALPATPLRGLGVCIASFSGISGSTTFQARFGRAGGAGTLTAQQTCIDVFEFKK